jgi:hypothetical protein
MAVAIAQRDLSIEHIYQDSRGNHILSYTINRAVLEGDDDPIGSERVNPFHVENVKADAAAGIVQSDPASSARIFPAKASESNVEPSQQTSSRESNKEADGRSPTIRQPTDATGQRGKKVSRDVDTADQKPPLPQQYKPKRTRDNPAGVRDNPYIDRT